MSLRRTSMGLVGAILAIALPARGQTAAATADPPRAADTPAATSGTHPTRLRASHRVDVIAPGESVDTVIDRMRAGAHAASTVAPAPSQSSLRPGPREPGQRPDQEGGPPDGARGTNGGPPGGGPPPDRPHR